RAGLSRVVPASGGNPGGMETCWPDRGAVDGGDVVEQGQQVLLDRPGDLVEREVVQVLEGEGVLELDAHLIERKDRVGDENDEERRHPVEGPDPAELADQGAGERGQEQDDEPPDDDRLALRRRGLEDALAAADVVDELGALAVDLEEAE